MQRVGYDEMETIVTGNESGTGAAGIPETTLASQQRAVAASSDWFAGLLTSVQEQAESYTKLLAAMDNSLVAVSRAFDAQIEANRAMKEVIDLSRSAVASARVGLERSTALSSEIIGALTRMSRMQLETFRAMTLQGQGSPSSQIEAFQRMTQDWWDTYRKAR